MTDRRDDLVDVFLADLGSAHAPDDLAPTIARRIRDERPPWASHVSPWLAAAAVIGLIALATFAWVVAGPRPSPTPVPSMLPAPPSERPSSPASPTASPDPTTAHSPTPTVAPAALGFWDTTLRMADLDRPVAVTVLDFAGTMTGVAQATRQPPATGGGAYDLAIGPGGDARSLTVAWVGGGCDERAQLELGPDGHTLALRFPPRPACDSMGIGFAVELRFKAPVDPARFQGHWSDDLVTAADVRPEVVSFADRDHGWVGGTTTSGDAIILETKDAGVTWRVEGLGIGRVTDIGVAADGLAWAGRACADGEPTCHPGLYRYDDSGL